MLCTELDELVTVPIVKLAVPVPVTVPVAVPDTVTVGELGPIARAHV